MREVLIAKKVFQFEELELDIQKRLIEKYQFVEVSHDGWWDPIYEGMREHLREYGIDNIKLQFSGFGSQGDGASFTTDNIDLVKFITKFGVQERFSIMLDAAKAGDITAKVKRNGSNYLHEKSVDVILENDVPSEFQDRVEEFESFMGACIEEFCNQAYRRLEKYYDELTSEENIKRFINENLGEFEENGELYLDIDSEVSEEGENDGNNNKSETTS